MKFPWSLRYKKWRAERLTRKLVAVFTGTGIVPVVEYNTRFDRKIGSLARALEFEQLGLTGPSGFPVGAKGTFADDTYITVARSSKDGRWYGWRQVTLGKHEIRSYAKGDVLAFDDPIWSIPSYSRRAAVCPYKRADGRCAIMQRRSYSADEYATCGCLSCPASSFGRRLATGDIELMTDLDARQAASFFALSGAY